MIGLPVKGCPLPPTPLLKKHTQYLTCDIQDNQRGGLEHEGSEKLKSHATRRQHQNIKLGQSLQSHAPPPTDTDRHTIKQRTTPIAPHQQTRILTRERYVREEKHRQSKYSRQSDKLRYARTSNEQKTKTNKTSKLTSINTYLSTRN